MLQDLDGVSIQNLTGEVLKYVEYCPACCENSKPSVPGRSPNEVVYDFKPRTIVSTPEWPENMVGIDTLRQMYQKEAEAAMDFPGLDAKGTIKGPMLVGLLSSKSGFDAVMVVVDKLLKFKKAMCGRTTHAAGDWPDKFFKHVYPDWLLPDTIISDMDSKLLFNISES
ncbi:hypothetical protein AAE478_006060 [Parahypoxylon ruwenzoriense]